MKDLKELCNFLGVDNEVEALRICAGIVGNLIEDGYMKKENISGSTAGVHLTVLDADGNPHPLLFTPLSTI